jgi:Flp pilus assembly protein TadG
MQRRGFCLDTRGQSLVELALLMPVLVFGLIGGTDMGRGYAVQVAVQNGARAAAEAASLMSAPTPLDATNVAIAEMKRTPGVVTANATVTLAIHNGDFVHGSCAAAPTLAQPCYSTVRVRYAFRTVVPWPLVPNSFNFDTTTTYRRY